MLDKLNLVYYIDTVSQYEISLIRWEQLIREIIFIELHEEPYTVLKFATSVSLLCHDVD